MNVPTITRAPIIVARYATSSGSVYDVAGKRVRRVVQSAESVAKRVGEDWRQAVSIQCDGVGHPLTIIWGTGTDEHSPAGADPEANLRATITTPVTEIAIVEATP